MKKAADLFWKTLSHVTLFCFLAMLLVMIVQVFCRDVLRVSVSWTDELTRYFFIWAIFLGSALAQRTREHIRITVLVDRLSPRLRKFFNTVIDLFWGRDAALWKSGKQATLIDDQGAVRATYRVP